MIAMALTGERSTEMITIESVVVEASDPAARTFSGAVPQFASVRTTPVTDATPCTEPEKERGPGKSSDGARVSPGRITKG